MTPAAERTGGDGGPDPEGRRLEWRGEVLSSPRWVWRANIFLCGFLLPLVCFSLDPLFAVDGGGPLALGHRTLDAFAMYAELGLAMLGMALYLCASAPAARRIAAPFLALGVIVASAFCIAFLPITLFTLFTVVLLPLGLAPHLCLVSYGVALREVCRGNSLRQHLAVWACALLIGLAPLAARHALRSSVQRLRVATQPSQIAGELAWLQPWTGLLRRELQDAYLAMAPREQRRLRALYLERTGRDLLAEFRWDGRTR